MYVTYEQKTFSEALPQLLQLDQTSIHPAMFLTKKEIGVLQKSRTIVILAKHQDQIIGATYALPATDAEKLVHGMDRRFVAGRNQLYFYSLITQPECNQKEIGVGLLTQLMQAGRRAGYVTGCSHTSLMSRWSRTIQMICRPVIVRVIKNFWKGHPEPDLEFISFNLYSNKH